MENVKDRVESVPTTLSEIGATDLSCFMIYVRLVYKVCHDIVPSTSLYPFSFKCFKRLKINVAVQAQLTIYLLLIWTQMNTDYRALYCTVYVNCLLYMSTVHVYCTHVLYVCNLHVYCICVLYMSTV